MCFMLVQMSINMSSPLLLCSFGAMSLLSLLLILKELAHDHMHQQKSWSKLLLLPEVEAHAMVALECSQIGGVLQCLYCHCVDICFVKFYGPWPPSYSFGICRAACSSVGQLFFSIEHAAWVPLSSQVSWVHSACIGWLSRCVPLSVSSHEPFYKGGMTPPPQKKTRVWIIKFWWLYRAGVSTT